ncbi:MAG: dTDP-4-dehydrorhamnose 3,5-epimerase [Anaerolineales bacterium]
MIFEEAGLEGAYIIEPDRLEDERGFFARVYCKEEFEAHGLNSDFTQCSISFNERKGTLRGMHYQVVPHQEAKLVRCTMGAIYDVILDLRSSSPTFEKWQAVVLTADNRKMLYVPEGCAHGFQTLEANSEVHYQMSVAYQAEAASGIKFNDPAFGIVWPICDEMILSNKDLSFENYIGR